jgi:integrase
MVRPKNPDDPHEYGAGSCFPYRTGWRCDFYVDRKNYSTTGATAGLAQKRKRAKIRALEEAARIDATPRPVPVMTMVDWINRWRRVKEAHWTENTQNNYKAYFVRILSYFGDLRLDEITEMVVVEKISDIPDTYIDLQGRQRRFGNSCRRHLWNLVSEILGAAARSRATTGLTSNPLDDVEEIPWTRSETEEAVWTPDQVEMFFEVYWNHRHCHAVGLAAFCALRESEILGLRWRDIDLDACTIRLQSQLLRSGRLVQRLKSKKEGVVRRVAIPPSFARRLAAHKAAQDEARLRAGALWESTEDFVVTTYLGGSFGHRNLLSDFSEMAEKIGLSHIPLHGLRHSWNSTAKAKGVSAAVRQAMMGHSSLRMTERYDHVFEETILEAAKETEGTVYPWLAKLAG